MKNLGKIIFIIGFASVLLLLYVHEQIALFHVSYLIDEQSSTLGKMSEEYRRLKFEVDQLRSPRFLEEKMEELSLDLTLPQEIRVVRIPQNFYSSHPSPLEPISVGPMSDRILNFLGRWVEIAQAKTDN